MSSRSLSPPRRRRRRCDDDHRAEPTITSLYLCTRGPSKFPRASSIPALAPSTTHVPIRPSLPLLPPYESFDQSGLRALHQPQHQGESGSGSHPQQQEVLVSEFELDSPPRITVLTVIEDEPGSPTSPPRGDSPPSMDMKPAVSPTFGTDTDTNEHDFSDKEDMYFKSLVDNFVAAVDDVCNPALPEDNIDYKAFHPRKSDSYVRSALMHYNADEKNKVKYELVSVITSCGIVGDKGCCGHVNFIAKGNQQDSKEELFFAELRANGYMTFATTCVVSLEGRKSVGGLRGTRYDYFDFSAKGLRIDAQHCYACSPRIKHPKDGSLYQSGHVACSDYYFG